MSPRAFVVFLALLILAIFTPSAMAKEFKDIANHWAAPAIRSMHSLNVMDGYPDGTFRPESAITREQFAALLVRVLDLKPLPTPKKPSFHDVPPNSWAYSAIESVKRRGLIQGYPGQLFLPTQKISRLETLVVLVNAAQLPLPNEVTANRVLSTFEDQASIPKWAKPAVAAAVLANLHGRPDGNQALALQKHTTRGEMAVMSQQLRHHLKQPTTLSQKKPAQVDQGS